MAFKGENVSRVRADFERRREEAEAESQRRKMILYGEIPEVQKIDRELSAVGMKVMEAAMRGGDVVGAVKAMQQEHEALQAKRADLLKSAGYPADYSDIRYRCEECKDTGFLGTKMCACLRRELVLAGYESSGIGALLKTQSFDSFSLSYYEGAERETMVKNVAVLSAFARDFSGEAEDSFLLLGSTGLGKTHLSTSVARTVIDKGYDVVYDTAIHFFSVFEGQRFGRADAERGAEEKYFETELLILDDLGTELTNQFTVSCLYNVINTRLNRQKSTIINTNLTVTELRDRYDDRITSRLLGEYRPLLFKGKDIRAQKLKEGKK